MTISDKSPDNNNGPSEFLKKLWLPVAGFIGAVTLAYNFYKMWLGDQGTVTVFIASSGLLVMVITLGWVGFGYRNITRNAIWPIGAKITEKIPAYSSSYQKVARIALIIVFLGMVISVWSLVRHRQVLKEKLVVLIVAFEGPEEVYGLRNEIIENITADFLDDEDVEIVVIDDVITLTQGSEYARKLGERQLADIVIWGWYRPTENPNITIHIENLTFKQLLTLDESTTLRPVATLQELESFTFQQQAGKETSALVAFLAGVVKFRVEDYENAIIRFDRSIENIQDSAEFFENLAEIYFFRGTAKAYLDKNVEAIADFNETVKLKPWSAEAFINRGTSYAELSEYERAIQDYNKAIEIDPQLAVAYNNRGNTYGDLGEYERAIQDYNKAIEIDPQYAATYNNRGVAYTNFSKSQIEERYG